MWAPEHLFSFIPRYVWDEQILPRRVQTVCLLQLSPHICFILIAILFSFLPAFLLFYIWLISIIFCLFLFCLSLLFSPCYPTLFSLPVITVMFASNASRLCTETHARTTETYAEVAAFMKECWNLLKSSFLIQTEILNCWMNLHSILYTHSWSQIDESLIVMVPWLFLFIRVIYVITVTTFIEGP